MNVEAVADLGPERRAALFDRESGVAAVRDDVAEVVERVRTEGDVAVREYTEEFDGLSVGNLDVTDAAAEAVERVDDELLDAIETAAGNVRDFHERQVPEDWRVDHDGRELGRRFRPLERVGVYVPGGAAAYPSSALMGVLPAKVAGVEHVVVATPPAEELNPATLAAVHVAGADEVVQVGGAQAVAAMAYGTESVTPVQKVVGPGNKWVTAAKAEVRGDVDSDFLAGPSEVLVVADESADPELVAADLVAQAEHDPDAAVAAVLDDDATAEAVAAAVDRQSAAADREETVRSALDNDASGVFAARSMSEAITFADGYAAEHLSIQAEDADAVLDRISDFGSAFLGPYTPVAAGDYASGTNHVLPTGGGAKRHGGLSVDEFLRGQTVQRLSADALGELSDTITTLAEAEGLTAHADSVRRRFDGSDG
jgi:histidinol dehydrogenase